VVVSFFICTFAIGIFTLFSLALDGSSSSRRGHVGRRGSHVGGSVPDFDGEQLRRRCSLMLSVSSLDNNNSAVTPSSGRRTAAASSAQLKKQPDKKNKK
jgi:hypothetical protein